MRTTSILAWEETLTALLPLVGRQLRAEIRIDGMPVSAFAGQLHGVEVEPAVATGVEQARLDFTTPDGLAVVRFDEHLGTVEHADGELRIEMLSWTLTLGGLETAASAP